MAAGSLTEIVAAVVVHSSAAAFLHFGVTLEPAQVERTPPAAERVVARSPRAALRASEAPARTRPTSQKA